MRRKCFFRLYAINVNIYTVFDILVVQGCCCSWLFILSLLLLDKYVKIDARVSKEVLYV